MTGKKLYKSYDRKISGVCGGLAEYFDIDPAIVRLIFALITVTSGGTGIILYLIASLIMEDAPGYIDN